MSIVPQISQNGPFSMLPYRRPPWKQFLLVVGLQSIGLFLLTWVGVLNMGLVPDPVHDYHFIGLVDTPPQRNLEPAPVIPAPRVASMETPAPNVTLVPPPEVPARARPVDAPVAPNIEVAAAAPKPVPLPPAIAVIPRQLVKTNTFSDGSSTLPTIVAAPQHVQTGGFGDPNAVPTRETQGRPVNIAPSGSFDLPTGPGYGNGNGDAKGVPGAVASSGFGSGTASVDGSGKLNTSRGTVQNSGFGDAASVSPAQLRPKPADDSTTKMVPAEVISKPTPTYTPEARNLRIEGEVVLEVVFEASGSLRILRIVHGLGHGLDDSAVHAAQQIRFKPAKRDGQPADYTALVHIVFQLA
jgi:TonB family protein